MAKQWFYEVLGEETGPVSDHDLKSLADRGVIDLDTPIRNESSGWTAAAHVRGLFQREKAN